MSVEHLAAVLHHSRAKGTAKLVLLGIANHAGDGGSWPSVRTLATYANVDPRNVQMALARLEELGEVARHLQAGGTNRTHANDFERPNLYEVLVACPEGCDGTPQHRPRKGYRRGPDGAFVPVDNSSSDRVTESSPPAGIVTPPPDGNVTQTVPLTGDNPRSASLTVTREAVERHLGDAPCDECSAPGELECLRRQLRLASDQRHPYTTTSKGEKDTGSAGVSSTSGSAAAVDNEQPAAAGDSPPATDDKSAAEEEG